MRKEKVRVSGRKVPSSACVDKISSTDACELAGSILGRQLSDCRACSTDLCNGSKMSGRWCLAIHIPEELEKILKLRLYYFQNYQLLLLDL